MTCRLAAALVAAAGLAAPAAAAAAPVLSPLKPCYVADVDETTGYYDTEDVHVTGSGFTPNALVLIAIDGAQAAGDVPVDANGMLDTFVKAPYQDHGLRPFTVTATEQEDTNQTASTQSNVTRLEVLARPRIAKPTQHIRLAGGGFTLERPIFAHYVRHGKLRRTVRLASRPDGACGTFSVRRRQFPFRPKVGKWIVRIDQQRRYRPNSKTAFVNLAITVKRQLRTTPKSG